MSQYFIRRMGGSPKGPFSSAEIRDRARSGDLRPDDEVSRVGEDRWVEARRVRGLFPAEAPMECPPAPFPAMEALESPAAPVADPGPPPHRAPAVGSIASPAPGPARAAAVRIGAVDRFLRFAFGFGRAISAIVLFLAGLVIAAGVAVIGWTFVPEDVDLGSGGVDPPVITTFIRECTEQANAAAAAQQGNGESARGFGSFSAREDPCGPYRAEIEAALRRLSLPDSPLREVLCAAVLELPLGDRRPWLDGLTAFANEFPEYRNKGYRCDGRDALAWYADSYEARLRERSMREQAAIQRSQQRATLRQSAIAGIGTAIGAILAFLILPLLIQIERNTRMDGLRLE